MINTLRNALAFALTKAKERGTGWLLGYLAIAVPFMLVGIFIADDMVFGAVFGFILPAVFVMGSFFWLLVTALVFGSPYTIYVGLRDREFGTVCIGILGLAIGVGLWYCYCTWIGCEDTDY